MGTHVLLNLLRGLPSILSLFCKKLYIYFYYTGAQIIDSFHHRTLKLLKDHILACHIQILLSLTDVRCTVTKSVNGLTHSVLSILLHDIMRHHVIFT